MKNLLGPAVIAATIAFIMPVAAQQGTMATKPAADGGMAAPAGGGMMAHTDAMASGSMKKATKKKAGAMGSAAMSGGMASGGMASGAMKKDPSATH